MKPTEDMTKAELRAALKRALVRVGDLEEGKARAEKARESEVADWRKAHDVQSELAARRYTALHDAEAKLATAEHGLATMQESVRALSSAARATDRQVVDLKRRAESYRQWLVVRGNELDVLRGVLRGQIYIRRTQAQIRAHYDPVYALVSEKVALVLEGNGSGATRADLLAWADGVHYTLDGTQLTADQHTHLQHIINELAPDPKMAPSPVAPAEPGYSVTQETLARLGKSVGAWFSTIWTPDSGEPHPLRQPSPSDPIGQPQRPAQQKPEEK